MCMAGGHLKVQDHLSCSVCETLTSKCEVVLCMPVELLVCVYVFLPLLPRNMKMVDIVAQKMPSENDVLVARSFLTKILRSSMRYEPAASL